MSEEQVFKSVGGVRVAFGTQGEVWNFGWVAPAWRDDPMHEAHERIERAMPAFGIVGKSNAAPKADLTKLWKHPTVVAGLGFEYTGTHQLTGSCVGAGGGNVAASLAFREVVVTGDPERVILPFYPYTYGRSRLRSGMRGRGEGSTGSGWAEAATKDGVIDNALEGLPKPTHNPAGLVWGAAVEMEWSAGDREPCTRWTGEGGKHLIKTASKLTDSGQVWDALVNGYPVTCASMYAYRTSVEGGVLLGRRSGQWAHQMSFHACWEHDTHGRIYWLQNQWGDYGGRCPTGMPAGGCWIKAADVDWICRDEVYAFSNYDGYPALTLDWSSI